MSTVRDVLRNPWLKLLGILVATVCLLFLLYYLRQELTPFLLALIIAYILDPAVNFLSRFRIPRGLSAFVLLIGFLVVVSLVIGILIIDIGSALTSADSSVKNISATAEKYSQPGTLRSAVEDQIRRLPERFQPAVRDFAKQAYVSIIAKLKTLVQYADEVLLGIIHSAVGLIKLVVGLLIFIVITFFTLRDFPAFVRHCRDSIPQTRLPAITNLTGEIDVNLRGFFRGQLTVAVVLTIVYFTGLTIAGIPYALPVAIVAGMGNLIPYVGTLAGIIVGLTASFTAHGFDIHLLYVFIVFAVAQGLEGALISPYFVGKNVGLHPVVIILSLVVFGKLFGFFGLLFAVPLAAVLKVLIKRVFNRITQSNRPQTTST